MPIGVASLKTGYWLLGLEGNPEHGNLLEKFGGAGKDLWQNVAAAFTDRTADWQDLSIFYDEVFFPYLIGGILPGLLAATVCYYVSLPLVTAYQKRRKGTLKAKLAAIKKKKAEQAGRD